MKSTLNEILARLPGQITSEWPGGEPFKEAFRHGSMLVEVFAPRGEDTSAPQEQDELYIVVCGRAKLRHKEIVHDAPSGSVLFVPAGDEHRLKEMTGDFITWVVFWGLKGGEQGALDAPSP